MKGRDNIGKIAEPKKMGRPTDAPKGKPIHIRLDEKSNAVLEQYALQENVSRAEAIRRGIQKLEAELNDGVLSPNE